jgi:phage terminase large subunit-like protein
LEALDIQVPEKDINFDWTFDALQADFVAVDWFATLRHVKGRLAGESIVLIDTHRWEISMIFGWVSKRNKIKRTNGRMVGVRRFLKAFVTEGRKNSKTTRGSGIGLYMMMGDMEQSPEVYCTAVDRQQARVLYNSAKEMGEQSREIRKRLKIGKYEINHRTRGGIMVAFSGEVKNKDAFNPSCAFVDEYHAHPTSDLYDLLETAQGQRAQPLLLTITTAGEDIASPCYSEYEFCKTILEGKVVADRYFCMIREMDESDDERDPSNWEKANPLIMSDPIAAAEFKSAYDLAMDSRNPTKVRKFRVKKLNKWVEGNESSYMGDYLLPSPGERVSAWDKCAVSRTEFIKLTYNHLSLYGFDLSKRSDLTAMGNVFLLEDERVAVCSHGFLPRVGLERHEQTDNIPYADWARFGWLTITEGDIVDFRKVDERLKLYENNNGWKAHELCYDPYAATYFMIERADEGYMTVEVAQQMRFLSEPTKLFRDMVAEGKVVHDGSPLLWRAVKNALEIVDSKENIMLTKRYAGDTKRIDPLSSIITALVRLNSLREVSDLSGILDEDWGM